MVNLTVSQVILRKCDNISATIGGVVYNATTIIGIPLAANALMSALDMTITTGYNSGSATIIFTQS